MKDLCEMAKTVQTPVGPSEIKRDRVKELLEIAWTGHQTNPNIGFEEWYNTIFADEFADKYAAQLKKINEGELDEGFFGAVAGLTFGPALMKKLLKVVGIDENGTIGKVFTSRLVLTAMGYKM